MRNAWSLNVLLWALLLVPLSLVKAGHVRVLDVEHEGTSRRVSGATATAVLGRRQLAQAAPLTVPLSVLPPPPLNVDPRRRHNRVIVAIMLASWAGLLFIAVLAGILLDKHHPGLDLGAPGAPLFPTPAPTAALSHDALPPGQQYMNDLADGGQFRGGHSDDGLLEEGRAGEATGGQQQQMIPASGGADVPPVSILSAGMAAQMALDGRAGQSVGQWHGGGLASTASWVVAWLELLCGWRSAVKTLHALVFSPRSQALRIVVVLVYDFAWCGSFFDVYGPRLALILALVTSSLVLARFALSLLTLRASLNAVETLMTAAHNQQQRAADDGEGAASGGPVGKKAVVMTALVVNPDGELLTGCPESSKPWPDTSAAVIAMLASATAQLASAVTPALPVATLVGGPAAGASTSLVDGTPASQRGTPSGRDLDALRILLAMHMANGTAPVVAATAAVQTDDLPSAAAVQSTDAATAAVPTDDAAAVVAAAAGWPVDEPEDVMDERWMALRGPYDDDGLPPCPLDPPLPLPPAPGPPSPPTFLFSEPEGAQPRDAQQQQSSACAPSEADLMSAAAAAPLPPGLISARCGSLVACDSSLVTPVPPAAGDASGGTVSGTQRSTVGDATAGGSTEALLRAGSGSILLGVPPAVTGGTTGGTAPAAVAAHSVVVVPPAAAGRTSSGRTSPDAASAIGTVVEPSESEVDDDEELTTTDHTAQSSQRRSLLLLQKCCCCCVLLPLWPVVGALMLTWGVLLGLLVLVCWAFVWPTALDRKWGLPPAFMASVTLLFAIFKCIPTIVILLFAFGGGMLAVDNARFAELQPLLIASVCLNMAMLLPAALTATYTHVLRPWVHLEHLQLRLLPVLQQAISAAQAAAQPPPPHIPLLQAALSTAAPPASPPSGGDNGAVGGDGSGASPPRTSASSGGSGGGGSRRCRIGSVSGSPLRAAAAAVDGSASMRSASSMSVGDRGPGDRVARGRSLPCRITEEHV